MVLKIKTRQFFISIYLQNWKYIFLSTKTRSISSYVSDVGSLSIQITDKTSEIPYIHQLVRTQKAVDITVANITKYFF